MMPLTLVLADEGKNGLFGPGPSSSISIGTVAGFAIRYSARRAAGRPLARIAAAPAAMSTSAIDAAAAHRRRESCERAAVRPWLSVARDYSPSYSIRCVVVSGNGSG